MARMIELYKTVLGAVVIGLGLTGSVIPVGGQTSEATIEPSSGPSSAILKSRLGQALTRYVRLSLSRTPLTTTILDASLALMDEIVILDGENPETWRLMLQLATLAEREDKQSTAISRVLRLDPRDETVRLRRLSRAIEQRQTASERISAYEALLGGEHRAALGDAVYSHLALDLARLHRRYGNLEQFSYWIAESAAIDSSNHAAAAMVAGFYQAGGSDPYGLAELLLAVVEANPTDSEAFIALAKLLLEHGAYRGAARMYGVGVSSRKKAGFTPTNGLLADQALALWAAGRGNEALDIIQSRQQEVNHLAQIKMRQENHRLLSMDVSGVTAPLDPLLAAIRLAIHRQTGAAEGEASSRALRESYEQIWNEPEDESLSENTMARIALGEAWLAIWLGEDRAWAEEALQRAKRESSPLQETARLRFDGWLALRAGKVEEAWDILSPLAENDIEAQLGLIAINRSRKRTREAAQGLLEIARRQTGSMVGIWAGEELAEIIQMRPTNPEATRLEDLLETRHQISDRYPEEPTLAFSGRIKAISPTFSPFAPILVDVILTNHTLTPFAIDAFGPIRPHLVISTAIGSADGTVQVDADPIVIDIDRRLRLLPREEVVVRIDLREYPLGQFVDDNLLAGSLFKMQIICNAVSQVKGGLVPGLLGSKSNRATFRVDGVRTDEEWVRSAVTGLEKTEVDMDPELIVLLSYWVARNDPDSISAEEESLVQSGVEAITSAYSRLDSVGRSWALILLPEDERLDPVRAMAKKSESRLERMAYLLRHIDEEDDPMLDAGRRSDDPAVQKVAALIADLVAHKDRESDPDAKNP